MVQKSVLVIHRLPAIRNSGECRSGRAIAVLARAADSVPVAGSAIWEATISGEPVPAVRLHDVLVRDGRPRLIRSHAARLWLNRALVQLRGRRPLRPVSGDLSLECRFWLSGPRVRVEEGLIIESLERAGIIANALQIRETHLFTGRDADPRIAIALRRVTDR